MGAALGVCRAGRATNPLDILSESTHIFWMQVFSNLVNFKSFGFTKFVPRVSESQFAKVVGASASASNALPMWEKVLDSLPKRV